MPVRRSVNLGHEAHFYGNDLALPPFSLPDPVRCVPQAKGFGFDETCLWALQTAEMKNWLDRAKRTRISGYNRRTKWTVIGGGEEAGA